MVLHKSLYYGFNGYQVPSFPRASRSARGKSSLKRKADEKEMCAFELLATVAGELLQEGGNCLSASNTAEERVLHSVRQEEQDEKKPLKVDSFDESGFVSDLNLQGQIPNKNLEQSPHPKHDIGLEHTSLMANASFLDKYDCMEVGSGEKRKDFVKFSSKICGRSPGYGEPCSNVVEKTEGQLESERKKFSNVTNGSLPDTCSTENPMELDISPPTLASLDKSVEVPHTSFLPFQANAKLVCKDNDENSSACTHPSTRNLKAFRPPPRIGDRRIRRLLASKYWKISHKYNDRELSRHDMRHVFRNVKSFYTHQRFQYQRNSNFRKRKLLEHRSISKSDARSQSEVISKPSRKGGINEDATNSASRPSLVAPQESSFQSRDSRVKLSIKSFRVPELFIEIPESATVGSLKRTVTEAVSAILGGGLCVGVVLQGKKVRDDNKTLLQTGISHDDKLDALGFMLEPNPSPTLASAPAPQPLCHVDPPFLMSYNIPQPLSRYPKTPGGDPVPFDASPNPTLANGGTSVENAIVVDSSPRVVKAENTAFDPGALIFNSTMVEPLTAVPLDRKSAQFELAQRRIRRPFSVSEVEALVQAVEKLGTGRWRDVKLLAFDNVEHRTYVDLKDKWKTLVHTAKISPGQRRGEPVPQELLDRVLAAHGHWSQEQGKQQIKLPSETCLHLFKPIEERSTLGGGSLEF